MRGGGHLGSSARAGLFFWWGWHFPVCSSHAGARWALPRLGRKAGQTATGKKTRRVGTVRRYMPGTVPYNIFTDGLWAQAWPLTGAAAFSPGAHAAKKLAFCPRPPSFASDRRIFCHSALCICNLAAQPTQVPLPFPPSSSSGRRRRRAPGEYETTGTFFSLLSTMAADRWIL